MKTFARLIRRYVLAAVAISLLLVIMAVAAFLWVSLRFGLRWQEQFRYSSSEIADNLQRDGQGDFYFQEHDAEEWMGGYSWAMVLDDTGQVIWRYRLPQELDHAYTASEVAVFSRWYLQDYPVFCQVRDYGLLVIGMPKGSTWKYNFWTYPELVHSVLSWGGAAAIGVLVLILILCLIFSWRGSRSLQVVARGLDALAEGRTVELPTKGFAGELAEKLNQTSAQLQYRNEIIQQRDTARTNWIAGVSHDIRTPLSLILGWAEQMQRDTQLPDVARQKAGKIQIQSEKIKSLIEDLNLTSKLQYGVQPLRCKTVHAGPLLRTMVADFCNEPMSERCEVELELGREAENVSVRVDAALLARAIDNVLGNSVRHNSAPVHCRVKAEKQGDMLCITCTDDGVGYPAAVLTALQSSETGENTPHILGLHVVEQILQAHGGRADFEQNSPRGSKVILHLPIQ